MPRHCCFHFYFCWRHFDAFCRCRATHAFRVDEMSFRLFQAAFRLTRFMPARHKRHTGVYARRFVFAACPRLFTKVRHIDYAMICRLTGERIRAAQAAEL